MSGLGQGLFGFFCCFLPFQMKGRKRNPAQRRENSGFIARTARLRILVPSLSPCLRMAFSLGEGLGFLPFFRKGKKYPEDHVNPVSLKLI